MANNYYRIELKTVLIIVSIGFIISLILNGYFYTQLHGISENGGLEGKITSLQEEINTLMAPKLISANLGGFDKRPFFQTPRLQITGYIFNIGNQTAKDCKLHVVLYQGNIIVQDTYIKLGNIAGETGISIDEEVFYDGEGLTDFIITPEWKSNL